MFARILKVGVRKGHKVRLAFDDGMSGVADFSSLIEQGGVFAKLADAEIFSRVQIGENGRYLEWPDGIDFCADALRKKINAPTRTREARTTN